MQYSLPQTYRIILTHIPDTFHIQYMNEIFLYFFVDILPSSDVLRIMDCYLIEGIKILYRYFIAIMVIHKIAIKYGIVDSTTGKRNRFKNGNEVWEYIRGYKVDPVIYANIHEIAFDQHRRMLSRVFPLHCSREYIRHHQQSQNTGKSVSSYESIDVSDITLTSSLELHDMTTAHMLCQQSSILTSATAGILSSHISRTDALE